jgi:hypothetical protein
MGLTKHKSRDDFALAVKRKLAARAGHLCSNAECRAPTSGPQLVPGEAVSVGVACHISAAAPGGPRFDDGKTRAARSSIENGIWLCQTCAKLIDSDEQRYTEDVLRHWKSLAEREAHRRIGKTKTVKWPSSAERELKRNLKLRDQMRKDFLKPWDEVQRERPYKGGAAFAHPYEKFRYRRVIIHRVDNDVYPEIDEGPGISSWFRLEPYDFYHRGVKFVLGIESGVLEIGCGYVGNGRWAMTKDDVDFDAKLFRKVSLWRLGLIPFCNIRHYDLEGDEYYNYPHIYCDFSIDGMPYEDFEFAVVGKDEYDWPLKPELRVTEEAVLKRKEPEQS